MSAVSRGYPKIVDALIEAGAEINNVYPPRMTTVLFEAAYRGHSQILDSLIAAGADVNLGATKSGSFALFEAVRINNVQCVK
jgi:ankyrin repeat protein